MIVADIMLGAPDWWTAVTVVLALAVVAMLRNYARAVSRRPAIWSAAMLKAAAFVLLAFCLVEPLWSGVRPKPGANLFLLLADTSQSMSVRDAGSTESRGERLANALKDSTSEMDWQKRLAEKFLLSRYVFDNAPRRVEGYSDLKFAGHASRTAFALQTMCDQYRDRPVAGVLLFTDGSATDWPAEGIDPAGLPPIYPVLVSQDGPIKDLAVKRLSLTQTAFEETPVSGQVDVDSRGYRGEAVVAQLLDAEGKTVQEQTAIADSDSAKLAFRFQWRPSEKGVSFYRVRVLQKGEVNQFDATEQSAEATLANNIRSLAVDRGAGPYRILYLAGRPNWEYKFLRRSIEREEELAMVGLIRIAKREPKFDFRARAGESSNPLFRGFDKTNEETESYDQPVFVRLDVADEGELRDGFPKSVENLFAYHAVILDDVEAEFFSHEQMTLLRRFVSERGGGLLMLGGQDSFHDGKYDRTPIADLLPVYVNSVQPAEAGEYRVGLTREGWLQPWVRLRGNENDEAKRLEQMPTFVSVNHVRGIKPGASILSTLTDGDNAPIPALAVQQFGEGRCGALLIGDLWRWAIRREPENEDLEKSWRQTLRWLVHDSPGRVTLTVEPKRDRPNQPVIVQVRVRDQAYLPLDNAAVEVRIRANDELATSLPLEPSLEEAGLYQATFVPRQPGAYRAESIARNSDGKEVGTAATGWVFEPAADEFASLAPDRKRFEDLARRTGGEMLSLEDLTRFVDNLDQRAAPITERWTAPLWHDPFVLLAGIACLALEWGMRRRRGLR